MEERGYSWGGSIGHGHQDCGQWGGRVWNQDLKKIRYVGVRKHSHVLHVVTFCCLSFRAVVRALETLSLRDPGRCEGTGGVLSVSGVIGGNNFKREMLDAGCGQSLLISPSHPLPGEHVALPSVSLILDGGLHSAYIFYQCFAAWSALGRESFSGRQMFFLINRITSRPGTGSRNRACPSVPRARSKAPRSAGCRCRGQCVTQFSLARKASCSGIQPARAQLCSTEPPGPFRAGFHPGWFAAGTWSRWPCCVLVSGDASPCVSVRAGSCAAVPGLAAVLKAN